MIRFKGKIAVWFWAVVILCNFVCIYPCFLDKKIDVVLLICFIICNLIFLPMVFRNYVEIQEDKLVIAFGFSIETVNISEITEMYESNNPLASTAASLDRIIIKAGKRMLMCSVVEKSALFEAIKERNPKLKSE